LNTDSYHIELHSMCKDKNSEIGRIFEQAEISYWTIYKSVELINTITNIKENIPICNFESPTEMIETSRRKHIECDPKFDLIINYFETIKNILISQEGNLELRFEFSLPEIIDKKWKDAKKGMSSAEALEFNEKAFDYLEKMLTDFSTGKKTTDLKNFSNTLLAGLNMRKQIVGSGSLLTNDNIFLAIENSK
jgi:hypothetical protein